MIERMREILVVLLACCGACVAFALAWLWSVDWRLLWKVARR